MTNNICFFHSNRREMCAGDIVLPGSYGRLVEEAGADAPFWDREQALERTRKTRFPDKPSRLNACFATHDINTARFYHERHCSEGILYLVSIVDCSQPWHLGDFNCIEPLPRYGKTMEEIAEAYWSNTLRTTVEGFPNLKCEEVITASALEVHGRIFL